MSLARPITRAIVCGIGILLLIGAPGCANKKIQSKPVLRVYLVRHAEAYKNVPHPADMTPEQLDSLTVKGVDQSKAAGVLLRGKNIVAVISSPANRAQQTAKIISKAIDIDEEATVDEAFAPLKSGKSTVSMAMGTQMQAGDKGESLEQGVARAREGVERLAKEYRHRAITIVSHGDIIPGLIGETARTPMDQRLKAHDVPPGAVTEIIVRDSGWELGKR